MQNLYDLLGVRPDDDAENIKKAFRKAAKASHPDHHGGDPRAATRFRRISKAYEILRDAEKREAYDRLLALERRPLRHKLKRSLSGMKRHVVQDLTAGALLALVLAVGYELYAHTPKTPGGRTTAGVTLGEAARADTDLRVKLAAARDDRPERAPAPQMPVLQMPVAVPTAPAAGASAANDHDRLEKANGEPVSNPAGQTIAVASRGSESDVPTGASVPGKTDGAPPVQRDIPSLDAPSSAAEERGGVPAADDRRDGKALEPAGANTGGAKPPEINVKLPETRMSVRPPAAPKRHTPSRPNRAPIEQAELENRNTPPPDNVPSRVFGVGF